VLLIAGFAQAFAFWRGMRLVLDTLTHTPLLGAFERLPPALLHDRLSPRAPVEADLERSSRFARQLGLELEALAKRGDQSISVRRLGLDAADYQAVKESLLACGVTSPDSCGHAWTETATWRALQDAATHLCGAIANFWRRRPRATILAGANFDHDVASISDDTQRWYLRAEELVAMQLLLIMRDLLSRLINIFFYIIAAVLMLVVAQQSFPFQPRQILLGIAWADVLVAVFLILRTFIQMEHHPVLSAITSTEAGAITWDAKLWAKVLVYGLIPLATIFAAQFPQLGSDILRWLTPVQSALP
jgi:hypothetical protein